MVHGTKPATVASKRAAAAAAMSLLVSSGPAMAASVAEPAVGMAKPAILDPHDLALLDRVTWGANAADAAAMARMGADRWLEQQLHPPPGDRLPPDVQAQIDAMPYDAAPMTQLVADFQLELTAAAAIGDQPLKFAARQIYGKGLEDAAHQAAARSILTDLYSPNQLQSQMTWFWFNHFNVQMTKADLRLMIGDYEDHALRPHALGRFRDLLEATLRHPAMLRYLDNAENAVGHINENYAREIMELHTMGVGSGYTQGDVQELARILTGVGVAGAPKDPPPPQQLKGQLIRAGLFEFNPARHDYGDKVLLGHKIKGAGFSEVEQALDILSRNPATARHISQQLAVYFVSDNPPPALVQRMSQTFIRTDGDIAQVLEVMFHAREFQASLGAKFKDPAHYVISSVRLAYNDRPILNTTPIAMWLTRMGEGLYSRETPDGYAMAASAWDGPGQMETRFEMSRQFGAGGAGLFKAETPGAIEPPGHPDLQAAAQSVGLAQTLAPPTRASLAQAASPGDWNILFLASPEFMRR